MRAIAEYDTKLDDRGRLTIKGVEFQHFRVKVFEDSHVEIYPRMLVDPTVSRRTLAMMDQAMSAMAAGEELEEADPAMLRVGKTAR